MLFVGAALAWPEVRDPWLRQMGLELGGNAQLGALVREQFDSYRATIKAAGIPQD